MKAELKAAVQATGSHLMDICGIGPAGAARILADLGNVARFPGRSHFASWTGTAPIDASSGQHTHHRLSRAGNRRRLNHVLHMASIVQLRNRHPRPCLLPAQARRRQDLHGSDAPPALAPVRRGLPPARRRRRAAPATQASGAGRAPRGVSVIQRGRPSPGHRHFGPATSRTRTPDATPAASSPEDNPRGPSSCHTAAACQRCQRAAPCWTNDVDAD
jgi:transposase